MLSLRTRQLGKAYKVYNKPIDSLKEWFLRRPCHRSIWALRDIDLALPPGASLGVIGENGAGKTTLLQLLAGTIKPSCGQVERNGRVSAILELGSGFHPDLSGRENIRIGCATLGFTPSETRRLIPEIIRFSELEDFIDHPVKIYSTGMYARLAFSVASVVAPDIMVVDEALSVGDQHFQKKSIDRMVSFKERGKTLIFCSHTLYHIRQVCDLCLWLRNGRMEMFGEALEVTDRYQDYTRKLDSGVQDAPVEDVEAVPEPACRNSYIVEATVGGDCRNGLIEVGGQLTVRMVARLSAAAVRDGAHLGLLLQRNDRIWCYGVSTLMDGISLRHLDGNDYGVCFVVDRLPLLAGEYSIDVGLIDNTGLHIYEYWRNVGNFKVVQLTQEVGMVRLDHRWVAP